MAQYAEMMQSYEEGSFKYSLNDTSYNSKHQFKTEDKFVFEI